MGIKRAKVSRKISKVQKSPACNSEPTHPDHSSVLNRLSRVQGQLVGIENMVQEGRYCVDILVQFRAAMGALRRIEVEIFETHLRHCVREAFDSRNPKQVNQKIKELTELLARRTQL